MLCKEQLICSRIRAQHRVINRSQEQSCAADQKPPGKTLVLGTDLIVLGIDISIDLEIIQLESFHLAGIYYALAVCRRLCRL